MTNNQVKLQENVRKMATRNRAIKHRESRPLPIIKANQDAFTEKEAALIMKEICLAVKHLHDMNIAHR